MILLSWIAAFFVLAVPYTIYYNRWQRDYMETTGAKEPTKFSAFLRTRVADPGLERRRKIGSYASYGLIGWGIIGFVIPPG